LILETVLLLFLNDGIEINFFNLEGFEIGEEVFEFGGVGGEFDNLDDRDLKSLYGVFGEELDDCDFIKSYGVFGEEFGGVGGEFDKLDDRDLKSLYGVFGEEFEFVVVGDRRVSDGIGV
jgi:hypothetical protein